MTIKGDNGASMRQRARQAQLRDGPREDVGFEERIHAWAELRALKFRPKRERSQAGNGEGELDVQPPGPEDYANTLRSWRKRIRHARRPKRKPGPPASPPATNWIPVGPSVVRRGQAVGNPPVSGRTAALALAPGGMRVYAATANGGVWRSDDGGSHWYSLLDGWDLNPTSIGIDSQACGAAG